MLELKLFYFVCSWFCFIIVTPICNIVLFSCYTYATLSQDQLKWRQNTKPLSCKNFFLCIIVQHCCDIVECDLYIVLTSLEMILFSEKFNCVMVLEVYSDITLVHGGFSEFDIWLCNNKLFLAKNNLCSINKYSIFSVLNFHGIFILCHYYFFNSDSYTKDNK